MEHDTTRGEANTRRAEARSRGKTRGSKEIPVYFHKVRLPRTIHPEGEEKSRCKGKQDVANRNLSRRPTPVFAPRANIRGPRNEKVDERRCRRELSQPLVRPILLWRGTFLISVEEESFLGGELSKRSKWWLLYTCAIFLCFVLEFLDALNGKMKIRKDGE